MGSAISCAHPRVGVFSSSRILWKRYVRHARTSSSFSKRYSLCSATVVSPRSFFRRFPKFELAFELAFELLSLTRYSVMAAHRLEVRRKPYSSRLTTICRDDSIPPRPPMHVGINREHRYPDYNEVQQRLTQPALQQGNEKIPEFGVRQSVLWARGGFNRNFIHSEQLPGFGYNRKLYQKPIHESAPTRPDSFAVSTTRLPEGQSGSRGRQPPATTAARPLHRARR